MAVLDAADGHHVADVAIGDGPDAVVFDAAEAMIYSSNGESGTMTAVHEDDPDHYTRTRDHSHPDQCAHAGARSEAAPALPRRPRVWAPPKQANGRPAIVPDSFSILTVGQH